MESLTLKLSTLKAAATHAADKDVRYYLVGVCVDLDAGRIVATDGHRAFIAEGPRVPGGGQHILPAELVKSVCKVKVTRGGSDDVTLQLAGIEPGKPATAQLTINGATFASACIDGTFPDYARVIPKRITGETAQFNVDDLADATAALRLHFGQKKGNARIEHNGNGPAIMHTGEPGAFVLVMPMRAPDSTRMLPDLAAFIGLDVAAPVAAAA